MALFKISKGPAAGLASETPHDGYCWFTPDNGKFYIDVAKQVEPGEEETIERVALNAAKADSALSITINSIDRDISDNIRITPAEHKVYLNNAGINVSSLNIEGLDLESGDLVLYAGGFEAADIDAVSLSGDDGILIRLGGNSVVALEYYKELTLLDNSNNTIGRDTLETYKTFLIEIYDINDSYLTHLVANLNSTKTVLRGSTNTYTNNNGTITTVIYYFLASRNSEEEDFTYEIRASNIANNIIPSYKIKLIGLL